MNVNEIFKLILPFLVVFVLELVAASQKKPSTRAAFDVLHEIEFERHFRDNPVFDHKALIGSQEDNEAFQEMSDEDKRARLLALAKSHDFDGNKIISRSELRAWIWEAFSILDHNEVEHKFAEADGNGDHKITESELIHSRHSHDLNQEMHRKEFEKEQGRQSDGQEEEILRHIEHDKLRFKAADVNKDQVLNKREFEYITHPENFDFMIKAEVDLTMAYADLNGDGYLTLREFLKDGASKKEIRHVKETLQDLDKDGDTRLSRLELQAYLLPDKHASVSREVARLIMEADENEDDRLTLKEIINKEEDFIRGPATNYGHNLRFVRDEL